MNKRKMLGSLVAAAMLASLILVAAACREGAEPTATPALSGIAVKDADGSPVLGMRLGIVAGTAPFPEIAPVTDEDGVYRFPAIPPGAFSLAVHDGNTAPQSMEQISARRAPQLGCPETYAKLKPMACTAHASGCSEMSA